MVYNMTILEKLHVEENIWQGPKSATTKLAWLWVIGEGLTG